LNIIGISAFYHNSAASLFINGVLVGAIEEERISRNKFDASFPELSINSLLYENNLTPQDIDLVCYYENPKDKLKRQFSMVDKIESIPYSKFFNQYYNPEKSIKTYFGKEVKIEYFKHHMSHMAFSFYASGFKESTFLIADAVGEEDSLAYGHIDSKGNVDYHTIRFPHSVGMLYSVFTEYLGYRVNSDEYKVMGLAAYGEPKYLDKLELLVDNMNLNEFKLNLDYFEFNDYFHKKTFSTKLEDLISLEPLKDITKVTQEHKDLAASIQCLIEKIILGFIKEIKTTYPKSKKLCLGGGVALNSVCNMKISKLKLFDNIYIPSSPGDAGSAIGCAYLGLINNNQKIKSNYQPYLGRNIKKNISDYKKFGCVGDVGLDTLAKLLHEGNIIGVVSGRSEFGPRALGNRSILANPAVEGMKDKINLKVKNREGYRPFAPVILEEEADKYFKDIKSNHYMTQTYSVKDLALDIMPEAVHIDKTARAQTVSNKSNPWLYELIKEFYALSGCPALINTSFNLSDEPIVDTDLDAIMCYLRSDIDYLYIDGILMDKKRVAKNIIENAKVFYKSNNSKIENQSYSF
jgi:carbamoyltransferase